MSDKNIKFEKSDKPDKKYKATFIDPETKKGKDYYQGPRLIFLLVT